MQIEVLRTLSEMNTIADEWNNTLEQSARHVPFLRHEYLSTWWSTLGGGEWSDGELYVVTTRQEDGALGGIAPLFATENLDGEPALMLLGSIEISDYLDVIAPVEKLGQFLELTLEHLDGPDAPPWQVLDWYNILEDSPTLPALESIAVKRGWAYTHEPLQHCPYIPLADDWDTYLAGIDKKQRHEIRRKIRRAENNIVPVRWYIVEEEEDLEAEIDGFMSLMAQDPEKDKFLTEVMRSQMRAAVHSAYRAGWLQLSFLEVGGEKAAGYLNFDYKDRIWVYNSGLDFSYRELSPGWVLLGYLIQWAIENKRQAFDFMRGDERYKYRFGAVDRRVQRVMLRR
jgi:CelD/BcsL family acetyltransferase involved in cellulose biosynthesis